MRASTAALAATLLLAGLATPALSQSTATPPPFAAGDAVSYCHVTEATNTIWMNTLVDDGDGVPYEIFGDPAATDPVLGVGLDPVAEEAFEVRIPLSPALTQTLEIAGTVTVQAFIGSGAYGGGSASIATSLVAGGAEVGSAAAKDHNMAPKNNNAPQLGTTYDAISWTFDVTGATIPAGTLLEWVLSGTATGNNVFLACHEARGRSSITLPVKAASAGSGGTVEHVLNGTVAHLNASAAQPTNATHVYHWATALAEQQLRVTTQGVSGNASLAIVDGANATVRQLNLTGNLTEKLAGKPGNWTFTLTLSNFTGNVTVDVGPVPPPAPTPSGSASASSTRTGTASSTRSTTTAAAGNATRGGEKDTPGLLLPAVAGGLALVAVLRRRRD